MSRDYERTRLAMKISPLRFQVVRSRLGAISIQMNLLISALPEEMMNFT